jgi:hypothetical protein
MIKHTEPNFWKYFHAYFTISVASLLILADVLGWGGADKISRSAAVLLFWLGILILQSIKKSTVVADTVSKDS